jgi:two-component sensor histidine kinase
MKSFQRRLQALTTGYELSIHANWGSVALSHVVQTALEGYAGQNSKRLSITGPKLFLPAAQAPALVMVMHELADNAVRHGSLSQRGGKIQVSWNIARVRGRDLLRIDWLESGGPEVARPQKTGLGRKLIDDAVKSELRGTIAIDYAPPGVKAQLSMPIKVWEDAPAGR